MERKKDQGYTMIIVMCLMFLFMALALSMLFSSALLLARAEQAGMQKQSRATAVSFAEWMDQELEKGAEAPGASGLCQYVKEEIYEHRSWPSYRSGIGHEEAFAVREFKPVSGGEWDSDHLGELEVRMYWETENIDEETNPEDADAELVVTVKAVVKDEQYSITTRYEKIMGADDDGNDVWNGKWSVGGRE